MAKEIDPLTEEEIEAARDRVDASITRMIEYERSLQESHPHGWWATYRWRLRTGNTVFGRKRREQRVRTRIYEGRPGEGKTLFLTADLIRAMGWGWLIATNYDVWDPRTGQHSVRIESWLDVIVWSVVARRLNRPLLVGIDELQNWADSRSWQTRPAWWLEFISQHRKLGVGISGTTQNLAGVDSRLRFLVHDLHRVRCRWVRLPLRRFLPTFIWESVDPTSVDSGESYELGESKATWMPWYAFAGYSDQQPVPVLDWTTSREEMADRIVVTELARSLIEPEFHDFVGGEPFAAEYGFGE